MLYFRDWTLLLCFFRAVPEPGSLDPFLPKWMNEEGGEKIRQPHTLLYSRIKPDLLHG